MSLFITILAAVAIFAATVSEAYREERGLFDQALKTVVQPLGAVENAVSPDAMNSFCKQNGYTLWVGDGPEPAAAEGLINSAWSGWGKLTGAAVGAWAPEGVMMGKCEPLGWAKPGSDYARTHSKTTTYITQGQPGTYTPGTPGTTITYVTPGQPGSYQPGSPGTSTIYVTPGQPGTYTPGTPPTTTTYITNQPQPGQYQPGTPPTTTTVYQPGHPGSYQPGNPGTTTTYITPGQPEQMCQCPCGVAPG